VVPVAVATVELQQMVRPELLIGVVAAAVVVVVQQQAAQAALAL
jgi:hypothetical protein